MLKRNLSLAKTCCTAVAMDAQTLTLHITQQVKGVGCGLNNLQKLEDGEPLSGRKSAQEVFGAAPFAQQPAQAPQYTQPNPATLQPTQYGYSDIDPLTGQPIVIDPITGQRVM